jgi:hypothetical protein
VSFEFSEDRATSWSAQDLAKRSRRFSERLLTARDSFIQRNQEILLQNLETGTQAISA